jgi:hypothetical protein
MASGITSKKKDPTPKEIVPDDKENLHLSKAEFVEKQRKAKEIKLKLKEREAELKAEDKAESKKKPLKIEK